MKVGSGRVRGLLAVVAVALAAAGCGGGGGDPAPQAAPPAAYDFNGRWSLVSTVVVNECGRDVFDGPVTIVQNGTDFALTRQRNGAPETFRGTCDPAAGTFDFTYQDRFGTVVWHGEGTEVWRLDGWRTLPGPGSCRSLFNWTAVLESRN